MFHSTTSIPRASRFDKWKAKMDASSLAHDACIKQRRKVVQSMREEQQRYGHPETGMQPGVHGLPGGSLETERPCSLFFFLLDNETPDALFGYDVTFSNSLRS